MCATQIEWDWQHENLWQANVTERRNILKYIILNNNVQFCAPYKM